MLKFWKKKDPEAERAKRDAADATPERDPGSEPAADTLASDTGSSAAHAGLAAASPPSDLAADPAPDLRASDLGTTDAVAAGIGAAADAAPAPAPKKSWRERFAGSIFNRDIRDLFARNPKLDDAFLDELETVLIGADVGVAATTVIVDDLRHRVGKREFAHANALLDALRADLVALLAPVAKPLRVDPVRRPFVILAVGVNGVGKTTTIGKLARRLLNENRGVVLAAGDTFRAAAVEQLKNWGERNGVPVIAQGSGADSASVVFDALQSARAKNVDVLIADTAGRLHTQSGLMDELAKIRRVLAKLDADAPHEVLLVIDGTTGQNAISQTRQFKAAIGVTGLVVTKLDGTAKGGIVFALAKEFGVPIRFVGIGEGVEDLREFDPAAFVDALLPASLGTAS
jgi:fused signal recognition particle receptor